MPFDSSGRLTKTVRGKYRTWKDWRTRRLEPDNQPERESITSEYDRAKLREKEAQAQREVLRLRIEQANLIHREEVEEILAVLVKEIRELPDRISNTVAPLLVNMEDVNAVRAILSRSHRQALTELSKKQIYEH